VNIAHPISETWHPRTLQDREAVFSELEAILASQHFCNSKRYPGLLRFIVESALAGKTELLKERTLGIEVFDRPADYDTNADTVVRYTAGEVRKRLLLYYSDLGHSSPIRISLPAGSYVPEFHRMLPKPLELDHEATPNVETLAQADAQAHGRAESRDDGQGTFHRSPEVARQESPPFASSISAGNSGSLGRRLLWSVLISAAVVVLALGSWWKYHSNQSHSLLDSFWGPAVNGQQSLIICTGGSVFSNNGYSGVETANRDIDYPFVSLQSVSAAVQVSSALSRSGIAMQLLSAPSTPLTELREHSVVLLGAYNDQWTMHMQPSLRFYFKPGINEVILDRMHPEVHWQRDPSLPYSSADDYAIVARFRDPTIGGWVVILAGLGRNGTEAAAQFVTNPRYLELLRRQVGTDFSNRNIEAVLKVSVIEGKTGAPSLLTAHTW
jgi:hypothetical protein